MVSPDDLTNDQLLYNAVLWLLQNNHHEAAALLVECELEERYEDRNGNPVLSLIAPHSIHGVLLSDPDPRPKQYVSDVVDFGNDKRNQIEEAFQATFRCGWVQITYYAQLITEAEDDWREHLRELAKGKNVTNQGRQFQPDQRKPAIVWKNLRFRSKSEVAVAQALDRRGILYFPNCAARLGPPEHRHNKEPDFLICHEGKWGILEVDSSEFHPNRGSDDERDRQFKLNGIRVIERFQWKECQEHPDEVVGKFLALLAQS